MPTQATAPLVSLRFSSSTQLSAVFVNCWPQARNDHSITPGVYSKGNYLGVTAQMQTNLCIIIYQAFPSRRGRNTGYLPFLLFGTRKFLDERVMKALIQNENGMVLHRSSSFRLATGRVWAKIHNIIPSPRDVGSPPSPHQTIYVIHTSSRAERNRKVTGVFSQASGGFRRY